MVYEITDEELARALNQKDQHQKRGSTGYTDEELLQYLDSLLAELGEFPGPGDVKERDQYSVTTFYNHFGHSWRAVREAYDEWADAP